MPELLLFSTEIRSFFFFNDTATTEIYTLSLHDALPIFRTRRPLTASALSRTHSASSLQRRSEEHTSELQSRFDLVCRLLLEKKHKTLIRVYYMGNNINTHQLFIF